MKLMIFRTITVLTCLSLAPASADELHGTLNKIKDNNKVVLGVRDSSVPFSYIDDNQYYIGFTVDICHKIIEKIKNELSIPKIQIEYTPVTSSTRIPLISNGTVDLECSTTTNNTDRQKQVSFANTHFLSATRFISRKLQGIDNIDALKGKTIAVTAGSTNLLMVNKINNDRKLNMNVQPIKEPLDGFLLVESGRAAAFATDDVQLSILAAQSKEPEAYIISKDVLSAPEPYGIVMRKGDVPFKAMVDRVTSDLYRSPEIMTLYKKWFQSPVPPRGLNFNFPISDELKRAYENPSDSPDPSAYVR